jgi:hypothetical protein
LADPGGCAAKGTGLRSLAVWESGFETETDVSDRDESSRITRTIGIPAGDTGRRN